MTLPSGPWLVTGASGYLGRHLLEAIHASSDRPPALALVRSRAAWEAMGWTRPLVSVTPIEGEILSGGPSPDPGHDAALPDWAGDRRLDSLAGIFHLAALVRHSRQGREEVYRTNIEGTLAMVRLAASRRCRVVFVSTSGTVGCFRRPGASADELSPHCAEEVAGWPYYDSKVKAELAARSLADRLGVDLVIVRPPVLLGPGDHRFRSVAHVTRFLQGRVPFLIRGGMHFADVRDVAAALARIMALPLARPVYHLPGTVCSIEEFYRMTAEASGRRPPRFVIPYGPALWLARLSAALGLRAFPEPRLVEMASRHWAMKSLYADDELGYRSRPGRETLEDTVEWLRKEGAYRVDS